jgi:hypothetical protein
MIGFAGQARSQLVARAEALFDLGEAGREAPP